MVFYTMQKWLIVIYFQKLRVVGDNGSIGGWILGVAKNQTNSVFLGKSTAKILLAAAVIIAQKEFQTGVLVHYSHW